jgi:hypothetical protein
MSVLLVEASRADTKEWTQGGKPHVAGGTRDGEHRFGERAGVHALSHQVSSLTSEIKAQLLKSCPPG